MPEDFDELDGEEKLKVENDFIKMKMMLERGAEFGSIANCEPLPAGIENQFLRRIMEFEKQFEEKKRVTIFDKLGTPTQFKTVDKILDNEIESEWGKLSSYMSEYGVELSACSPKVTTRELYRFATEELFQHETDDIKVPDMVSGFIYDEFHPDYEYENIKCAIDDCIKNILGKEPLENMVHFGKKNLRLNKHKNLTQEAFKNLINRFKYAFDDFIQGEINADSCVIYETICTVKGTYSTTGKVGNDILEWKNNWSVIFYFEDDFGYWCITDVDLDGIEI